LHGGSEGPPWGWLTHCSSESRLRRNAEQPEAGEATPAGVAGLPAEEPRITRRRLYGVEGVRRGRGAVLVLAFVPCLLLRRQRAAAYPALAQTRSTNDGFRPDSVQQVSASAVSANRRTPGPARTYAGIAPCPGIDGPGTTVGASTGRQARYGGHDGEVDYRLYLWAKPFSAAELKEFAAAKGVSSCPGLDVTASATLEGCVARDDLHPERAPSGPRAQGTHDRRVQAAVPSFPTEAAIRSSCDPPSANARVLTSRIRVARSQRPASAARRLGCRRGVNVATQARSRGIEPTESGRSSCSSRWWVGPAVNDKDLVPGRWDSRRHTDWRYRRVPRSLWRGRDRTY